MIDSRTAAQSAFYSALDGAAAVTALADVWQNPPEGTEPGAKGLVITGLASVENIAGKDGGLDEVTIDILTIVRKPDVTELYALSSAVRNALEAQAVSASGALLSKPEFLSAEPDQLDDGETYIDTLRFRTIVQSA